MTVTNPRISPLVACFAVALVLLQHILYVAAALGIASVSEAVWLVVNSAEIVILFAAARMLLRANKIAAMVTAAVGSALLIAVITEDFILSGTLGNSFWLPMSSVVIFGLMVAAIFVIKHRP